VLCDMVAAPARHGAGVGCLLLAFFPVVKPPSGRLRSVNGLTARRHRSDTRDG
jgi:hypothetical protein